MQGARVNFQRQNLTGFNIIRIRHLRYVGYLDKPGPHGPGCKSDAGMYCTYFLTRERGN